MPYFTYHGNSVFYSVEGAGAPVLLLHGNTATSEMFAPLIPELTKERTVIRIDFLGCGQSDRLPVWPIDLWYNWGEQAAALIKHLDLRKVDVIGCSGGALAALNLALEHPELVASIVADSFEGLVAVPKLTEQIQMGRSIAKQSAEFRRLLQSLHGEDWEQVFDADTDAVIRHAKDSRPFIRKPISELRSPLLLTGSAEDEMFPAGHYNRLFAEIGAQVPNCKAHIFQHGSHPAALSNVEEFLSFCRRNHSAVAVPIATLSSAQGRAAEVHELVENAIRKSYAHFYQPDVVEWFCRLHNKDFIQQDAERDRTVVAFAQDKLVATGTLAENHIGRVFVDPAMQGLGLGSLIMDELERRAREAGFAEAVLETSIPAKPFYVKRGYQVISSDSITTDGLVIEFETMVKPL